MLFQFSNADLGAVNDFIETDIYLYDYVCLFGENVCDILKYWTPTNHLVRLSMIHINNGDGNVYNVLAISEIEVHVTLRTSATSRDRLLFFFGAHEMPLRMSCHSIKCSTKWICNDW